jgi:hypothetical protein
MQITRQVFSPKELLMHNKALITDFVYEEKAHLIFNTATNDQVHKSKNIKRKIISTYSLHWPYTGTPTKASDKDGIIHINHWWNIK